MLLRYCRITWKVVIIWFLCLCTLLSFYIVSDMKMLAQSSALCERELERLSKILSTCKSSLLIFNRQSRLSFADMPTLYIVTPTYSRPTQKAELTRLLHTLMHVQHVHWIVVEDASSSTSLVGHLLARSGLNFTHLYHPTPEKFKIEGGKPSWSKPKGVWQRNLALQWLRTNRNEGAGAGVVYFADDDNTYDLQIFQEMRSTKKVSVWPVGLAGGLKWEGPKIKNNKIIGWQTAWKVHRPFPIDMAGFAVNLQLILESPSAQFSENMQRGYVETSLLQQLISISQLEPKGGGHILVWHTRTEKPKMYKDDDLRKMNLDPNKFQSNIEV